jgi:hypothetical protein
MSIQRCASMSPDPSSVSAGPPRRNAALLAAIAALLLLAAYAALPSRSFAADDFEWLLNVRDLPPGELLRRAFDPALQTHFYRPLVWLLFWGQWRIFGVEPAGFHIVSLALHILNAALIGALAWRIAARSGARPSAIAAAPAVAIALFSLHPALFEAVTWVAAQSELLAAALLLAALHFWIAPGWRSSMIAMVFFALALLTKESAAIGLALLLFVGSAAGVRLTWRRALPPVLLTGAYLLVQAQIVGRNYLVQGDGYGFGPQLILNPLRSLSLLVAPLPGTEDGSAAWLVPLGVIIALALALGAWVFGGGLRYGVAALAITLLPTAPFASPPDSRYLYLPAAAAALLLGGMLARRLRAPGRALAILLLLGMLLAAAELRSREERFATANGPGASLWALTRAECAGPPLNRMLIVEPPLAAGHAQAIVQLACGERPRPLVVAPDQVEAELRTNTLVVVFDGGRARVVQRTDPPR